jgi:hypothetical protein
VHVGSKVLSALMEQFHARDFSLHAFMRAFRLALQSHFDSVGLSSSLFPVQSMLNCRESSSSSVLSTFTPRRVHFEGDSVNGQFHSLLHAVFAYIPLDEINSFGSVSAINSQTVRQLDFTDTTESDALPIASKYKRRKSTSSVPSTTDSADPADSSDSADHQVDSSTCLESILESKISSSIALSDVDLEYIRKLPSVQTFLSTLPAEKQTMVLTGTKPFPFSIIFC